MRLIFIVFMTMAVSACLDLEKPDPGNVFNDPKALEVTHQVVEVIKEGDVEAFLAVSHPEFASDEAALETVATFFRAFPDDPDLEISHYYSENRVGEGEFAGIPIYLSAHDVVGGGKTYRLLIAVAEFQDECCTVTYFWLNEWMGRPSTFNDFTLSGKGPIHFLFLAGLILIPLFIVVTAVALLRDQGARFKIVWMFAIILALWGADLNWSTGEVSNDLFHITEQGGFFFNIVSIQLLGAGISKSGLFEPWIIELGSPIGAIAYWITRPLRSRNDSTNAL